RELTPHGDVELLLLYDQDLSSKQVTERVWYPLWERKLHLVPALRTVQEVQAEARRSLAITLRLFDARFVAGDAALFDSLKAAPLKRDKPALRLRLLPLVTSRHAAHPAVTDAAVPDLLDGRGGLADLQALRWLAPHLDERTQHAL